jgi:ketosteroid isomerase-like protein
MSDNVGLVRRAYDAFNAGDPSVWLGLYDPDVVLVVSAGPVRDLGDRVLALGTTRLTGKGSGAETQLPFTVVATFKGARITHYTDFGDRDRALEAAGLSE